MPADYILMLIALVIGGTLGSWLAISIVDRMTRLGPRLAGSVGLLFWFILSSTAIWLRFLQIDAAAAGQHDRNVGLLVGFIAIWAAVSLFGSCLGGSLAGLVGPRSKPDA